MMTKTYACNKICCAMGPIFSWNSLDLTDLLQYVTKFNQGTTVSFVVWL